MKKNNYDNSRISYQESCFIVNAMDLYIKEMKRHNCLSNEANEYYNNIINKYTKLENKIIDLRID